MLNLLALFIKLFYNKFYISLNKKKFISQCQNNYLHKDIKDLHYLHSKTKLPKRILL